VSHLSPRFAFVTVRAPALHSSVLGPQLDEAMKQGAIERAML